MHLLKTGWVRSIFKEKKVKGEFHVPNQDLMGQICLQGDKIEKRISCTSSGLDGSALFLKRENWKENFIYLFKTGWVRSIFKEKKLKGKFHVVIQDLMDQICLEGEKIDRRISSTYSWLDGSDLYLRRENLKENFMHLFRTWWVRSIFKERKLKGEFHALVQDSMVQIYF